MSRESILNELQEIFCELFDDSTLIINENTSSNDIADWDSLEHINLILAIESSFNIKFNMDEIAALKDVNSIIDAISEKE